MIHKNTVSSLLLGFALLLAPSLALSEEVILLPNSAWFAFREEPDLSGRKLLEAALLASGSRSSDIIMGSYDKWLSGFPYPGKATGESLLKYMHSDLLRRYSAGSTRIDDIFETGTFNCVSSAVFFAAAARDLGLKVEGVMTRDHAFCLVSYQGREIDVETTNRHGYNPGEKKEFTNAFGQTGFTYVPPRNYQDRTRISPLDLVGLILNNRIGKAVQRKDFTLALNLALQRDALTGSEISGSPPI